jgi:type IV secretory pathway VirJ component
MRVASSGLIRLAVVSTIMLGCFRAPLGAQQTQTLKFSRFSEVTLYSTSARPGHVVLFVSGDGGWNLGVIDMAKALASLDALVVGIDIVQYLRAAGSASDSCTYAAADLEALSQFVQKKLSYERYVPPVLVGYSSGATLVYAALVQAPPNTFAGAISMGFCPDLEISKPLCKGSGLQFDPLPKGKGYSFLPVPLTAHPWVLLQGEVDQVCNSAVTATYAKRVQGARLVSLPKVGHGFSVQANWMPQFREVFGSLVSQQAAQEKPLPESLSDLPLVELPARGSDTTLAVILSGDGGWAGIDKSLGEALNARGISVVGLNSLQYFWNRKTPDQAGKDLERILNHYLNVWEKSRVLLIGYSLGADVLPFMAARLPASQRGRIAAVALLGASEDADFEFHVGEWVGVEANRYRVVPEIEKLRGLQVLCLQGESDSGSVCPKIPPPDARTVTLPGGHHFDGNYDLLATTVLSAANSRQ